MDKMLQAMRGAEISQNGEGVDHRVERNHAEGAYPRDTHGRASLSSVNRGEVREKEVAEGVLRAKGSGDGCGAQSRHTGIGQRTRWTRQGSERRSDSRPRGVKDLSERPPVEEDGSDKWARGGSDSKLGRETGRRGSLRAGGSQSDGQDIKGVESCRNDGSIWAVGL